MRVGRSYSVDDMLVAQLDCTRYESRSSALRVLDLGCGLGSVLLIVAWAFRAARLVGLEALAEHVAYAKRNILLNRCENRARIVAADLRDLSVLDSLGTFDCRDGLPALL